MSPRGADYDPGMPDDVVAILVYVAGALALLAIVWKGGAAWADAQARKVRGDRPIGEERLRAYAAMVGAGTPAAAAAAALSSIQPASAVAPPPPPPPPSSQATAPPVGPVPDPHLLERIRALEAKVAALEAQVGAPAAADLEGMRAPRPGGDTVDASRPAGLRAFP